MFWLWVIVAVIMFAVSMYIIGRYWSDENEQVALIFAAVMVSAFWPLALMVLIVFGPFVGLYFLGVYIREKKNKKQ